MKKILVLVADYPNNQGGVALMYVHTRNKYYIQHNIDVTVLNFSTTINYIYEGIQVISLEAYKAQNIQYDVLVLHAPNLRNHYKFLLRYEKKFSHLVFFFHGHEVMRLNQAYPKPYAYTHNSWIKIILQDIYDILKLQVWHAYLPTVAKKSDYIFVSEWFYHEVQKYVRLSSEDLQGRIHIINNSVGEIFEKQNYNYLGKTKYDFISIRSYMDGSKYCVDIITEFAKKYPKYNFLLIGKGNFYQHNHKPENIIWIDKYLNHQEILKYINQSSCALLPTRLDAQGVMMCEFATYGIPVITSDLEVCKEVVGDMLNVRLIHNEAVNKIDLEDIYKDLLMHEPYPKSKKFSYINTVQKEEAIIKSNLLK